MANFRKLAPIYLAGHVMVVGFQSTYPTAWLLVNRLGGSKAFYGWTVAAYMMMALCSSLVFGWVTTRRRLKRLILLAFTMSMTGYFIYAFAASLWMVLVGRLLGGFGFGCAGLCLNWVAFSLSDDERTGAVATFSSCQFAGAVVGPILGAAVAKIPFEAHGIPIHAEAAAGLLGGVEAAVLLGVLMFTLDSQDLGGEEERAALLKTGGSPTSLPVGVLRGRVPTLDYVAAAALMFVYFTVQVTMGGTEAAFAPITNDYFDWSGIDNGLLYSGMFLMGFFGSSSVQFTSKCCGENVTLLLSQVLQVLGLCGFIRYSDKFSEVQFFISLVVFTAGFSSTFSSVVALYSKCIPEKSQGAWMGYFTLVSSAGRITGPVWQGYILKYVGINANFYGLVGLAGASLVLHLVLSERIGRAPELAKSNGSGDPERRLPMEASNSSLNSGVQVTRKV